MPHLNFFHYLVAGTLCNGEHHHSHIWIFHRCISCRIYGCKALSPYIGCCIAEEMARNCILCHQLGQFLASHMIVLHLSLYISILTFGLLYSIQFNCSNPYHVLPMKGIDNYIIKSFCQLSWAPPSFVLQLAEESTSCTLCKS